MSCTRPLKAYWGDRGRTRVVFDLAHSLTKISFPLPCGRCIGCRMEKARQWGMRCLHEAKLWPKNSYVTLTYSNDFLPDGGSLVVRDLQLFMKRLRKAREPEKLRFFAGGEYGDQNGRPHYHLLLFNCGFPDMLFLGNNFRGEPTFTSKELDSLWFQGYSSIGAVTFDSAVYCAKYALKKVNGDLAKDHYTVFDEDGVCYDRTPEFAIMSRRPGIGKGYLDKYGAEIVAHDTVVVNGREVSPPRYYRVKLEEGEMVEGEVAAAMEAHRARRKRMAVLNRADNTAERLRVKEKLMLIAADKKEKKI